MTRYRVFLHSAPKLYDLREIVRWDNRHETILPTFNGYVDVSAANTTEARHEAVDRLNASTPWRAFSWVIETVEAL